jgi:hypothetical protein
MNFLLLLLAESLRKRAPQLDLVGTDRKIMSIAIEDLRNYLKVHWNLVGTEDSESKLREKVHRYFHERVEELEEMVDLWTGMWLRKWNERVKLVIGDAKHGSLKDIHDLTEEGRFRWRHLEDWREVEEMALEALIRNGEICGTMSLAESLLKSEFRQGSVKKKTRRNDLVDVVNNLFKRARQLSESKGPLMFVRIDKHFWNVMRQDSGRKIH